MTKRILPLFLLAASCLAQTVPLRWAAELGDARPARFTLVRGDTVELAADLFAEGRPYAPATADASLLWQTNGMNALWWEVPAVVASNRVSATWTPTMDTGAASYLAHFRVGSSTGSVFRAYARLAMQHGPGDPVNALPLPVPVLDFDKIVVTNAPWGEGGGTDGQAVTNIVEGIVRDATNGVVRVVEGEAALDGALNVANDITTGGEINAAGNILGSGLSVNGVTAVNGEPYSLHGGKWHYNLELDDDGSDRELAVKGDLAPLARSDSLGTAAYRDAGEFATKADEQLVYQLVMGSNVVAEVTNYNSTARSPQLRLLQLDEGLYKTVWAETNGLTRTRAEANSYTDAAIAELAGRKADRNWGKYTSGLGAEAPSNTTWVSTPLTVIAGGYEYAKVITTAGEAWVLCSNGMVAGQDSNAYFRVASMDGESLFSVERSASVLIGVRAGGITCSGNTVSIPLDVVSSEAPVCYACEDLVSQNWVNLAEELPSWVTSASASGSAGSWVWTIETTARTGFFQFRALQEGRTVIRNNAPAELTQGIIVNGSRYVPTVNGSTLTWTLAQ